MDAIREAIAANQADAATYSAGVRIWMGVMTVAFLSSAIFALKKPDARWFLLAMLSNIASLVLVRAGCPELSRTTIGTVAHLVFWLPILVIVWRPSARAARREANASLFNTVFTVWLVAASTIMATSLVLDARTALSWLI